MIAKRLDLQWPFSLKCGMDPSNSTDLDIQIEDFPERRCGLEVAKHFKTILELIWKTSMALEATRSCLLKLHLKADPRVKPLKGYLNQDDLYRDDVIIIGEFNNKLCVINQIESEDDSSEFGKILNI